MSLLTGLLSLVLQQPTASGEAVSTAPPGLDALLNNAGSSIAGQRRARSWNEHYAVGTPTGVANI
jgi:hypothetical protein